MNTATLKFMNKFMHRHTFLILLNTQLGVELLGHLVNPLLTFGENTRLFFKAVASVYIPTSNVCGFQFFHILANTCYHLVF